MPTQLELDAMEAFQLSLGRQEEFDDLGAITLTNEIAEQGRRNYLGEGLPEGSLHFEDAIPLLKEANNKIEREIKTRRNNRSRRLMQDAIVKLDQAREAMIIRSN